MENTHTLHFTDPPGLRFPSHPVSDWTLLGAAQSRQHLPATTQPRSPAPGHLPNTHQKNITEQDINLGCLQSPGLGGKPEPARQPRLQVTAPPCPALLASLPASTRKGNAARPENKELRGESSLIYRQISGSKRSEPWAGGSIFPDQQPQFSSGSPQSGSGSPQSQLARHFASTSKQL